MSLPLTIEDTKQSRKEMVEQNRQRIEAISKARWLARTNMYYLCNEVLGYKDVTPEVHYGLVRTLQQFPLCADNERFKYDKPIVAPDGQLSWEYKPIMPMLDLPGHRRRLILDSRGTLKTTINVVAHTIQWILNYPDSATLVVHAKQEVAEDIAGEIREKFAQCEKLRVLFPELCPSEQEVKNFGNRSRFTIPGRKVVRREPTVGTTSIEAAIAGMHYDIIKITDCVESENSANKDRRNIINKKFGLLRNVLVAPQYWIDVEGTRYHYDDLYGRIIDGEKTLPIEQRQWKFYVRGCYKAKLPPGVTEYAFSPEELELPDLLVDGKKVSWWPERFPVWILEQEENDPAQDVLEFNSQRRNRPVGDSNTIDFPASVIDFVPKEALEKLHVEYYMTTVDTAETQNAQSNYSVITTCAWDSNNRCYVVDVKRDKMKPDELISAMFATYNKYMPISVRIEETSYTRGLRFGLEREMHLKGFQIPFDFVKPDNQQSKEQRIRLTLQPVLRRGDLRFSAELPSDIQAAIYQEFTQFPKGNSDDILDTLADQFQNKDFYGRIRQRKTPQDIQRESFAALIQGIDNPYGSVASAPNGYWDRTGGL